MKQSKLRRGRWRSRSPDRVFDLGDGRERIEPYQIVLIEGAEDDAFRYIDRGELQRLWPRLWLPEQVREAWESRTPDMAVS